MNMPAKNRKIVPAAVLAAIICAALLNGCGYGTWVQINHGSTATSDKLLTLTLHAEDEDMTAAFTVVEAASTDAVPALASDAVWIPVGSSQQRKVWETETAQPLAVVAPATDPAPGMKTIYVWFKDTAGNVSAPVSDTITYGSTAGGSQVCTTPGYCN